MGIISDTPETITFAEIFKMFGKDLMVQTFTTHEWAL